jgi:hypothetical protein
MLLLLSLAHAGRFDARAPTDPGHGWVYTGVGRSAFTTEFWEQNNKDNTFELPASWETWRVDVLAEVAVRPHLTAVARVPVVIANGTVQSERICTNFGMCDDVRAFGDIALGLRSPWSLGPVVVTGRLEVQSGRAYKHAVDDLGSPGDGNTDLIPGLMLGWSRELGPVSFAASGGVEAELAFGRPPLAVQEGVEAGLRWRWIELGAEALRYDSIGGLHFNEATSTDRLLNDPERFTDISNDFGMVAGRLGVTPVERLSVFGSAWKNFAVDNGPGDNKGITLGVSTWW